MAKKIHTTISDERHYIFPIGGGEPLTGIFAVKLGRGTVERGLCIAKDHENLWHVQLDGEPVSFASGDHIAAFGNLYHYVFLNGRRIDRKEYLRIIAQNCDHESAGIDVSRKLDINKTTPAF